MDGYICMEYKEERNQLQLVWNHCAKLVRKSGFVIYAD